MGKCRKCGKELTGIETTGWFGKLCEKCWQEQHYTQYPFKKGIDEKDKKIADLEAKLAEYQNDGVGDVIINSGKKIKELQQQLAEHNEFFNAFNCKNFNEFKDFISTFMLTPHEEQTLIKDLEQQLAEKNSELKKWSTQYARAYVVRQNDLIAEKEQLKQQLAEKDNRIAELKEELDDKNFCKEFADLYNENKILRAGLQEEQAQTAIEKLEKVKEFLLEKIAEKQSCFDSGNYNDFADGIKTICELMLISIENQIKELGGGDV